MCHEFVLMRGFSGPSMLSVCGPSITQVPIARGISGLHREPISVLSYMEVLLFSMELKSTVLQEVVIIEKHISILISLGKRKNVREHWLPFVSW